MSIFDSELTTSEAADLMQSALTRALTDEEYRQLTTGWVALVERFVQVPPEDSEEGARELRAELERAFDGERMLTRAEVLSLKHSWNRMRLVVLEADVAQAKRTLHAKPEAPLWRAAQDAMGRLMRVRNAGLEAARQRILEMRQEWKGTAVEALHDAAEALRKQQVQMLPPGPLLTREAPSDGRWRDFANGLVSLIRDVRAGDISEQHSNERTAGLLSTAEDMLSRARGEWTRQEPLHLALAGIMPTLMNALSRSEEEREALPLDERADEGAVSVRVEVPFPALQALVRTFETSTAGHSLSRLMPTLEWLRALLRRQGGADGAALVQVSQGKATVTVGELRDFLALLSPQESGAARTPQERRQDAESCMVSLARYLNGDTTELKDVWAARKALAFLRAYFSRADGHVAGGLTEEESLFELMGQEFAQRDRALAAGPVNELSRALLTALQRLRELRKAQATPTSTSP